MSGDTNATHITDYVYKAHVIVLVGGTEISCCLWGWLYRAWAK